MAKGVPYDPKLKAEIISNIRDGGQSVSSVRPEYNVSSKSIYTWFREGVVDANRNLILENNKLKKEIEQLYKLLGRATAEMQRSKDEPSWKRSTRDGANTLLVRLACPGAVTTTSHRYSLSETTWQYLSSSKPTPSIRCTVCGD
jgi:transposase-like protein